MALHGVLHLTHQEYILLIHNTLFGPLTKKKLKEFVRHHYSFIAGGQSSFCELHFLSNNSTIVMLAIHGGHYLNICGDIHFRLQNWYPERNEMIKLKHKN